MKLKLTWLGMLCMVLGSLTAQNHDFNWYMSSNSRIKLSLQDISPVSLPLEVITGGGG